MQYVTLKSIFFFQKYIKYSQWKYKIITKRDERTLYNIAVERSTRCIVKWKKGKLVCKLFCHFCEMCWCMHKIAGRLHRKWCVFICCCWGGKSYGWWQGGRLMIIEPCEYMWIYSLVSLKKNLIKMNKK